MAAPMIFFVAYLGKLFNYIRATIRNPLFLHHSARARNASPIQWIVGALFDAQDFQCFGMVSESNLTLTPTKTAYRYALMLVSCDQTLGLRFRMVNSHAYWILFAFGALKVGLGHC